MIKQNVSINSKQILKNQLINVDTIKISTYSLKNRIKYWHQLLKIKVKNSHILRM